MTVLRWRIRKPKHSEYWHVCLMNGDIRVPGSLKICLTWTQARDYVVHTMSSIGREYMARQMEERR